MLIETGRILLLIALCTAVGVVIAALASATSTLRFGTIGGAVDALPFGAAMGWLLSGVLVPMLWRRPIGQTGLYLGPAGVIVGAVAGLVAGTTWGTLCGGAALLVAGVVARRRLPIVHPDHPPGHCTQCGYPLTGLASPTCPECGYAPPTRRGG